MQRPRGPRPFLLTLPRPPRWLPEVFLWIWGGKPAVWEAWDLLESRSEGGRSNEGLSNAPLEWPEAIPPDTARPPRWLSEVFLWIWGGQTSSLGGLGLMESRSEGGRSSEGLSPYTGWWPEAIPPDTARPPRW